MLNKLIDISPSSKGNKFRAKRVQLLLDMIARIVAKNGTCSVLDVGGTYTFWTTWGQGLDWAKVKVDCINLDVNHALEGKDNSSIQMMQGDACDLNTIANQSYDLVFSNSVIEHVGLWRRQMAMANEVRRVGKSYFVQTPYFWFPVEPHLRTLFIHWLPQSIAYRMMLRKKRGFWKKSDTVSEATLAVQSAIILDIRQMRELFPDAHLQNEKFMGWTKSLIAIKDHISITGTH